MTINERIFKLLEDSGTSQKRFAQETGISEKTISGWKTRKSNPPAELLSSIADYFGVSLDYLIAGKKLDEENPGKDMTLEQLLDYYNCLDDIDKQLILHKTAEMYYESLKRKGLSSESPAEP